MEQSINRKNRSCSVQLTRWVIGLFFQLFIACVCLSVFAQEDQKDEPSQARPDAGPDEKGPNVESGATNSPQQAPPTQTPTETQPPSQPESEQQPPPRPESAQSPPSESAAPSVSEAATTGEVKPAPDEIVPSKPEATPPAATKPMVSHPQRIDTEERRQISTPAASPFREKTVCANGRTAVENKRSQWPPVRIKGELGFLASRNEGATSTWFSPLFGGWYRISDMVAVSADWGFSILNWSAIEGVGDTSIGAGNPFLAVHSVRQHGCTELRVGIGATVPVAFIPSMDRESERNFAIELYRGTIAMRGMWNWWLWTPDSMSVALPVSWETAASTNWIFGGEIALASTVFFKDRNEFLLPVEPSLQALLVIPLMGEVGYRIDPVILSIKLRAIWIVNDGLLQTSAVPGVRMNVGVGYVRAEFNLNLDKPYGFGAERPHKSKLWGLFLSGGVEF